MECREVRRLAEAFVSGQLLVETTQAIVAHLEQCPSCRQEIDGLRRIRAATRSAFEGAPDLKVSPEFAAALSTRLQATTVAPRATGASRYVRLAIAASVLLVAGSGVGLAFRSAATLRELLHAAVGDHQNCAIAFKLAERPISLEEAAVRFDVVNRALESITLESAALPGGPVEVLERHSCVFEGRRFAHIVLRYKDEKVSLLVTLDGRSAPGLWLAGPPSDGTTSATKLVDGDRVTAFHQAGHSAFVVSSLAENDLRDLARAMVGPVSRALGGA